MGEGFGGRVKVNVEAGATIVLEMIYETGTEGCLEVKEREISIYLSSDLFQENIHKNQDLN